MPKLRDRSTIQSRIYIRRRGVLDRHYGDFRDFADVGGGQEPLIADGQQYATTSLATAMQIAQTRLDELQKKRDELPQGPAAKRRLSVLIDDHLIRKAREAVDGGKSAQWLGNVQVHLETAEAYFGPNRDIALIELRELEEYRAYLRTVPNGRGGTLSTQSIDHYMNSLSGLYRRAIRDKLIPFDGNEVEKLGDLLVENEETPFLEVHELAAILRFAFETWRPGREELAVPFAPTILATWALTGMRESEGLGLLKTDVRLDAGIIVVQKNEFRRLKTEGSTRVLRIFPQLREILQAYLAGPLAPQGELFFPSPFADGREAMIQDLRKFLDKMPMPERLRRERTPSEFEAAEEARVSKLERALGRRRGPKPDESLYELQVPTSKTVVPPLRTKMLRHSYTAARLQCTDHGEPIAPYTVARELGHEGVTMVTRVYAHLGEFRRRGEHVEYRW